MSAPAVESVTRRRDPVAAARWAKVIDHTRCIGCHACSTACKSENDVPVGVNRTYVKYVDVGVFPQVRRTFQVTRCNQCDDAPCVTACPTGAMYRRRDGIVDFDKSICIGCKACIAACPYDAIFINPDDHSAEKCNFCAHRLDVGLEPACVVVCPTEAILVGDLTDPSSKVAAVVQREPVSVRRPEKETRPKLFYKGAHQATLDPLAARRPGGALFLWSEQPGGSRTVAAGHPGTANSSAAALLSYDVPHRAPWDWRVSLYTWTKSIAAGVYLVPAVLLLLGQLHPANPLWRWGVPALAGAFLAATGGLLIADLTHPERFWLIFARPRWSSWLVRGAFIIGAFAALLVVHVGLVLSGQLGPSWPIVSAGVVLAVATAVYTAYLFAQSKARDLWQNPLLPAHFLVQAVLAGSAALLPFAPGLAPESVSVLLWTLGVSSLVHVLLVVGDALMTHGTAHARLAAQEMTQGRFRTSFLVGLGLAVLAAAAPAVGIAAAPLALIGLLAYEHAFVQAGQAAPLA